MADLSDSAVYADYNATSPLRAEARAAMLAAMELAGNPSSIHGFGRAARKSIESARASILADLEVPDYRLAFTSGASEALATVLRPVSQSLTTKRQTNRLVIGASEHVAALEGHGFEADEVTHLSLGADGVVDLGALETALAAGAPEDQAMVCVQGANNETGVLQPIDAIAALCDVHEALFVCDLVQWAGRLPLGNARPAALVVSAHKLGGPAGIGALIYDPRRLHVATPLIRGGGQERGVRAGTENIVGIVGFAAALSAACASMAAEQERLTGLRDSFEDQLLAMHPSAVLFGHGAARVAGTSCFAIPGVEAALALMQFDLGGIALSSGSACSSGKVKASHVLAAMHVPVEIAGGALRLSLGFASDAEDVHRILASLERWSGPQNLPVQAVKQEISKKSANLMRSAIGESA